MDRMPPTQPADRVRQPQIAAIGRALGHPARAAMLAALMDDRAWTVGELGRVAGLARSSASEHVSQLVGTGLVVLERQGRHGYVRLAGREVAEALESVSLLAPVEPAATSLRAQRADAELVAGRTCYQHLAGLLGVGLTQAWIDTLLVVDWGLTPAGSEWFTQHGIDVTPDRRRGLLRPCLDWTERRAHAAGPLADRFCALAFQRGWVARGRHRRSVVVTPAGRSALEDWVRSC